MTHGAGSREPRFRALYGATYPDLLRFVSRRVHPSFAEDVVADTYLVAWRRLDDVPVDPGRARAWLFATARNSLLNERRGARRRESLTIRIAQSPDIARDPASDTEQLDRRIDLAAAWRRLGPADQEVLALTLWDGLSGPEAAAVLGISPVAYRLRLSRSRRAFRRLLGRPATPSPAPTARTETAPTALTEGARR
jgi:RNA polymerase sigma-70 factor (ECF subfamily)